MREQQRKAEAPNTIAVFASGQHTIGPYTKPPLFLNLKIKAQSEAFGVRRFKSSPEQCCLRLCNAAITLLNSNIVKTGCFALLSTHIVWSSGRLVERSMTLLQPSCHTWYKNITCWWNVRHSLLHISGAFIGIFPTLFTALNTSVWSNKGNHLILEDTCVELIIDYYH